ncbi:response regulator [Meiothermus rufus]|uniref:response regulator n=1 Tax=Meiothermus rufus TaxID=604332 RepID=UPI001B7F92AF|nr:response regulator [Meiothermus rufus]
MNGVMEAVRVLLVEDDPWVLQVNRGLVETVEGFKVVGEARSLAQGQALALSLKPDLLLVDVYLPDGTGLGLIRTLRSQGLPFEAVMITAANDVHTVQQALYDGVLDFLIKPFQRPRLERALARYLQRRQATQAPTFTQRRLDRLLGVTSAETLPKGIDEETLEQIRQLLEKAPAPLSAEEVGEQVGVSRVTAWRYLEYLCQSGLAELQVGYGGVGRPIKRYRVR